MAEYYSTYGSDSRPASRAQSDATERPGSSNSTRTISRDIEHIKSLITRAAQTSPTQSPGSITAQVFRRRSSSSPNVTNTHIFHELDQLKRRIKNEQQQQQQQQQQNARRLSQIDPDTESETESIPDGREAELLRARTEVALTREQGETLLEAAEARLDKLYQEVDWLKQSNVVLEGERDAYKKSLQARQQSLEEAKAGRKEVDGVLHETQERMRSLESTLLDTTSKLDDTESQNKTLSDQLAQVHAERVAHQAAASKHVLDLTAQYEKATLEVAHTEAVNLQLIADLDEAKTAFVHMKEVHNQKHADLATQVNEHKHALDHGHQQAQDHKRNVERLELELQAAKTAHIAELSDLHTAHDERHTAMCAEIDQARLMLEEAHAAHADESKLNLSLHDALNAKDSELEAERSALTQTDRRAHETELKLNSKLEQMRELLAQEAKDTKSLREQLLKGEESHQQRVQDLEAHLKEVTQSLAAKKTALNELKASLQSKDENARLDTLEKDDEIDLLRTSLADLGKKTESQVSQLVVENKLLSDDLKSHADARTAAQQSHELALDDLRGHNNRVIDDLKESHTSEIEWIHRSFQEAEQSHAASLERVKAEAERKQQALEESHAQDYEALRLEHDSQMSDLRAKHTENFEKMEVQIRRLEDAHELAMQELRDEHEATLAQTRNDAQKRSGALAEDLQHDKEKEMRHLAESHAVETRNLTAAHDNAIRNARQESQQEHQAAVEALQRRHADQEKQTNEQHLSTLADLQAQLQTLQDRTRQAAESAAAEHEAALADIELRHASELDKNRSSAEGQLNQIRAEHASKVAELNQERERSAQENQEAHNADVQDAQARYEALQLSHKTEVEQLQNDADVQLNRVRKAHAEELAACQIDRNGALQASSNVHEKQLADANERFDTMVASYKTQLLDARARHEADTAEQQHQHQAELDAAAGKAQQEYDAAVAAHSSALSQLKSDHASVVSGLEDDVINRTERFAADRTHLEDVHSRNIAQLEEKWSSITRDLVNSNESALQKVAEEASQRLSDAERRFETDLKSQETGAEHQIATLRKENTRQLSELRVTLTSQLESAQKGTDELRFELNTARANHERALAILHSEYGAEMSELDSVHKGQLKDLASKHSTELQHARQDLEARIAEVELLKTQHQRAIQTFQDAHATELRNRDSHHDKRYSVSRMEVDDARKSVDVAVSRTREVESDFAKQIEELRAAHGKEVEGLRSRFEAVGRARQSEAASYTAQTQQVKAKHKAKLNKVREEHAEELNEVRKSHETSLEDMRDKHRLELDSVNSRHAADVAELQDDNASQLARVRAENTVSAQDAEEKRKVDVQHAVKTSEERQAVLQQEHDTRLKEVQAAHDVAIVELKDKHTNDMRQTADDHERAIATLRTEHEAQLSNVRQANDETNSEWQAKIEAQKSVLQSSTMEEHQKRNIEHTQALDNLRSEHAAELEHLRASHQENLEAVQAGHEKVLAELRQSLTIARSDQQDEQLVAARDAHAKAVQELDQLRAAHAKSSETSVADSDALQEAKEKHAEEVDILKKELHATRAAQQRNFSSRLADIENAAYDRIASLQMQHANYTQEADRLRQGETLRVRHEHERELAETKKSLESMLEAERRSHGFEVREIKASTASQLKELAASYEKSLADRETAWTSLMANIKSEQRKALAAVEKLSDETLASKLLELERQHAEAMAAIDSGSRSGTPEVSVAVSPDPYRAAPESPMGSKLRFASDVEIRNLKKRHQDAVAQVRAMTKRQSDTQRAQLELKHKQELSDALENARNAAQTKLGEEIQRRRQEVEKARQSFAVEVLQIRSFLAENHQAELLRLETEHQTRLSDVEARVTDVSTKLASAEVRSQAQQTQLADIQEKHAEAISKQAAQNADLFKLELASLQVRLDAALTGQAEAERSLAVFRQKTNEGEKRANNNRHSMSGEMFKLLQEKEALTRDLEQARAALVEFRDQQIEELAKPSGGKRGSMGPGSNNRASAVFDNEVRLKLQVDEMGRQNDFLVKELEHLLAQRADSLTPSGSRPRTPAQPGTATPEPKIEALDLQGTRNGHRRLSRPVTPVSPGRKQAKEEIERSWKSRSFDEYMNDSQKDIVALSSVLDANETLFASKMTEYVSELQRSRDQLAADYNHKLDVLAAEKDRLERAVVAKQAASFAKERKELVASYGADCNDTISQATSLTSLPVEKARPLRLAEEKLVLDYNRRIAKRKSQIALKHAEEFQLLTQDFDRKMRDLVRHKRESDISLQSVRSSERYSDDFSVRGRPGAALRPKPVRNDSSIRGHPVAPVPRSGHSSAEYDSRTVLVHSSPADTKVVKPGVTSPAPRIARTSNPRNSQSLPRSSPQADERARSRSTSRPSRPGSHHSTAQTSSRKSPHAFLADAARYEPLPPSTPASRSATATPETGNAYSASWPLRDEPIAITPGDTPTYAHQSQATKRPTTASSTNTASTVRGRSRTNTAHNTSNGSVVGKTYGLLQRARERLSGEHPRPTTASTPSPTPPPSAGSARHGALGVQANSPPLPAPPPIVPTSPPKRRRSSSRHSSGLIYYNAPKQQPPPLPYNN